MAVPAGPAVSAAPPPIAELYKRNGGPDTVLVGSELRALPDRATAPRAGRGSQSRNARLGVGGVGLSEVARSLTPSFCIARVIERYAITRPPLACSGHAARPRGLRDRAGCRRRARAAVDQPTGRGKDEPASVPARRTQRPAVSPRLASHPSDRTLRTHMSTSQSVALRLPGGVPARGCARCGESVVLSSSWPSRFGLPSGFASVETTSAWRTRRRDPGQPRVHPGRF